NNIAGYGFYEWEVEHKGDSSEAQDVNARYAYLGVDFDKFGKVQVGRYEDPFEYAGNVVDNLEEAGLLCGMDERNSGHLSYMWSGYGFDAGVSYQFAEDNYNADMLGNVDVDSGFSVYAGYTTPTVGFGPISIRAAYLYLKAQDPKHESADGNIHYEDENDGKDKLFENFALDNIKSSDFGLSWGNMGDGWYVGTHYNYTKASGHQSDDTNQDGFVKFKTWESMVSYGFDNGVVLSAAYSYVTQKATVDGEYNPQELKSLKSKYAQVVASYDVNENFRVWGEAIFDCGSDDGFNIYDFYKGDKDEAANAFLVGARYTF
ncbi:MAG TPA: hypothetical protein DCL74_02035, partial [Succinivibrionaceae bacterium]|nr:hypothetical protein [Succinivibrionaceae bacterium]